MHAFPSSHAVPFCGVQVFGWPATQAGTVLAQAPTPQLIVPNPSSMEPLQSLSTPSQISAEGVPGVQVFGWPPTHAGTVLWHAPTPQLIVPRPSSTLPLQSLSTPSQASGAGSTSPRQGPKEPSLHVFVPAWQAPTPSVPFGPL